MADHIYYDTATITNTNVYVRFIRVSDLKIWDNTNEVMSVAPTYAYTAIAITKDANAVAWPVEIPAALPAGDYDMVQYDDATPANDDKSVTIKRISWNGKSIVGDVRTL